MKHKLLGTPMPHQQTSIEFSRRNPRVLDFSDPGTGKTFVRIAMAVERVNKNPKHKILILCPRTLMTTVWVNQFRQYAPTIAVVACPAITRAEAFSSEASVYVVNHDGVNWLKTQTKLLAEFDEIVIDESTAFKHHTSQRSKALAHFIKRFKYRTLMTGTPNTVSIVELWNQARMTDDGQRLGILFHQFRSTVCMPIQRGKSLRALEWADIDGAEEAVFGLIKDITIRHKRDLLDLPPTQVYEVNFTLPPRVRKDYDSFVADKVLAKRNKLVVGINAAVLRGKLLQLCSGAVYGSGETDEERIVPIMLERYELAIQLASESPGALVYFFWRHQRDALVMLAEKRNMRFAVMDGFTTDDERIQIEHDYQNGVYDVLFAHPKTVAHGVTLTYGSRTIWASPTDNLEWFVQGNLRQARKGQQRSTEIITIMAPNTLEDRVYHEVLKGKQARLDNLLDLLETR